MYLVQSIKKLIESKSILLIIIKKKLTELEIISYSITILQLIFCNIINFVYCTIVESSIITNKQTTKTKML